MHRRGPRALAGLVGLVALLAGCTVPAAPHAGPPEAPAATAEGPDPALPTFALGGTGCLEGGGHSVHPKFPDYLPAPWEPADVIEDTGPVLLTSEWWAHPAQALPEANGTMGNYHATVVCEAWTLDGEALAGHVFGFVGMKVVAPPFDAGPPADRHYLITVLGTSDPGLQERLHALGFHATRTTGTAELLAGGLFHNVLDTADHGVYEAAFATAEMGPMPERVRLWWQLELPNGTFAPVALDMANAGGTHLRSEGYGWFSHLRTEDHAPLPGAGGETPGVVYRGFDRVVTPGPRPNVALEEAYIHR